MSNEPPSKAVLRQLHKNLQILEERQAKYAGPLTLNTAPAAAGELYPPAQTDCFCLAQPGGFAQRGYVYKTFENPSPA